MVPESNKKMKNSYLILDEDMRFLNCTKDGKEPSESILKVGVEKAILQSGFDQEMFQARNGIYDWTKESSAPLCSKVPEW
jgi:radical S-adenosyl methionine domain-containing protein 2